MTDGNWYDNKQLFELINELQAEMRETRATIKKYNGLYEKVYDVKREIEQIKYEREGQDEIKKAIRNWGGWIFSFVTLAILILEKIG